MQHLRLAISLKPSLIRLLAQKFSPWNDDTTLKVGEENYSNRQQQIDERKLCFAAECVTI